MVRLCPTRTRRRVCRVREVAYEGTGRGILRVYCCACEPHYEAEVRWAHSFINHSSPDYNILSG